jgi:hypothetical protein
MGRACSTYGGREVYRVLVGKPEGKRPLERPTLCISAPFSRCDKYPQVTNVCQTHREGGGGSTIKKQWSWPLFFTHDKGRMLSPRS